MVWAGEVGPSLEIPIYDPVRLAKIKSRKAEAKIAAAEYRQTVLEVLEDLDTARTNLVSRRAQLAAAVRGTAALARARGQAGEQFTSGLVSQIEYLKTELRYLEARRSQAALGQAMLNARINFIKAIGGGTS
jgi:outer membrane protein TolC